MKPVPSPDDLKRMSLAKKSMAEVNWGHLQDAAKRSKSAISNLPQAHLKKLPAINAIRAKNIATLKYFEEAEGFFFSIRNTA